MNKGGYVYILTNKHRTVTYIGVTSELKGRVYQHKTHYYPDSFTAKYALGYCVYYERFHSIEMAIAREKHLKKWRKAKRYELVNTLNPAWDDLWEQINAG